MLASQAGVVMTNFARKNSWQIFKPRVVYVELEKHLIDRLNSIEKLFLDLSKEQAQILGAPWHSHFQRSLHPIDRIRNAEYPFSDLLVNGTLSPEVYERAGIRVLDCKLPNEPKNQQFKDSLLWEEILLQSGKEISLITGDQNFFQGKSYKNGLDKALRSEAREHSVEVAVFENLTEFLSAQGVSIKKFDERKLAVIANNVTFHFGRLAAIEIQDQRKLTVSQVEPVGSSFGLLPLDDDKISMQIVGECVILVTDSDGVSRQARLVVSGEVELEHEKVVEGTALLKEWDLNRSIASSFLG